MTTKLCPNCVYFIEGRCRLENRRGENKSMCSHYSGNFGSRGMIQ